MRAWAQVCALCFAASLPMAAAQPTPAPEPKAPALAPESELLLEVRLDRHVLSGGVSAYRFGKHVLLPLGELARLLTLAIRTDPARGQANGFILDEQRTLHLDAGQALVTLDGRQQTFAAELVKVSDDDIYVASELLARWLPIDIELDFSALALEVKPREPLPLQRRLERERRAVHAGPGSEYDPGYPRTEVPYRMWDMQTVDLTLGADALRNSSGTRTNADFTAFLGGDLLGLQSMAYLAGTTRSSEQAAASNFRLTLGRDDPDAGLLGPLRARSFAFGSVTVPALANVARTSSLGAGLTLSNAPLTQTASFGRHSLRGDLPPGWDVELFVNDALVGYQQSRADGRYAFDEIPLIYGPNEFRLMFNGPQGEKRIERQTLLLDQSLLKPGAFQYRASLNAGPHDGRRAIAQFEWGLGRQVSMAGGLVNLPLNGVEQRYANLGLRGQLQSVFGSADVVRSGSGTLAEVALQTSVGGVRLGVGRVGLTKDFVSEEFLPTPDSVRFRDRARVDWVVPVDPALAMPLTFELKREQLRSGLSNAQAALRVSVSLHGFFLTQELRRQSQDGIKSTIGTTHLSGRFASFGLRGGVGYEIGAGMRVTEGSLAMDHRLAPGLSLTAAVARSMASQETHFNVGFTKGIGNYGIRFAAGLASSGEASLGIQLLVAMTREPRDGGWRFDASPMADTGGVSGHVFLDRNLNGVEDEDDQPLPGVSFTIDGSRHPSRTNAQGNAYLYRLPTRQHVDVAIDPSSLENPQWAALSKGVRLVPRPGKTHSMEFAIGVTGEIDGTVYRVEGAQRRGIGGIDVELVDERLRVIGHASTGPDGFYIFEAVFPGEYRLRIAPAQLVPLGLVDTGVRIVAMSSDADSVNGVDLDLIGSW